MNKIALAAALLCTVGTALAQEIVNSSWYVQPSVAGLKADNNFGVDKRAWGGGLKFGKPMSDLWDVQFGATYARPHEGGASYHQTLLGADALLMLSRKNFRPFVLFGVGAERDEVENLSRNVSTSSPYVSVGLGFQLGLSEQWSMQADVRTVRAHLRDDGQFGFSRSNNKYLNVGFNYAFNAPGAAAAPMPAPLPVAAPVVETPAPVPPPAARFEKVVLSATELFGFDSAKLSMPQPKLDDIAGAMSADSSITDVTVTGYADRLGSAAYNLKLSHQRAEAVREYLVSKGIAGSRIKAVGKGEADPVLNCHERQRAKLIKCLAPNRRVEVAQITIERQIK